MRGCLVGKRGPWQRPVEVQGGVQAGVQAGVRGGVQGTTRAAPARSTLGLLVLALCLPGCTPSGAPAGTTVGAVSGGSAHLGDEATLHVPPGSLEKDALITLARLDTVPNVPADGFVPFGQGYEFTPHGTAFALGKPAVLTVRVDRAALAARGLDPTTVQLFHYEEADSRYLNVASGMDPNGQLVAAVEHFSKYVLLARAAALGNPGPTVTLQAPIPNPLRAGAPIFVRATVLDADAYRRATIAIEVG